MDQKIALVLAGGGLAGVVYELGALRAIDDLLVDRTVNNFDIYVGTSAGSIVAAGLANGLTPQMMLQSIKGVNPSVPTFQRRHLFQFNTTATLRRLVRVPRLLRHTTRHYLRHPSDLNLYDLLWELSNILPSAFYDSTTLETYLQRLMGSAGMSDRFDQLQRELYIVATSLQSGKRVVFGDEAHKEVPISRAVTASTAVPIMYKPVRIEGDEYVDGGLRGNASLDLAIERGAKLVVCINPLVPFDNSAENWQQKGYLSDQGMQVVIDQVLRIMLHAGLRYHIKQLRRWHPDVDIILIEPRPQDYQRMFANVMRYSTRLAIARHGYESVTIELEAEYEQYKVILARHGITINRNPIVVPQLEQIRESGADEAVIVAVLDRVAQNRPKTPAQTLAQTLDKLELLLNQSPS